MCTSICVTVYQKCKRNGIVSLGLSSFLLALIVKSVAIADSLDVTSTAWIWLVRLSWLASRFYGL